MAGAVAEGAAFASGAVAAVADFVNRSVVGAVADDVPRTVAAAAGKIAMAVTMAAVNLLGADPEIGLSLE